MGWWTEYKQRARRRRALIEAIEALEETRARQADVGAALENLLVIARAVADVRPDNRKKD